jgi:Kef-type K+ transport system membrane component KefB
MNIWLIAAIWMALALAASLGSIRLGISVALIEILLGVLAGNTIHLQTTPWIDFLAGTGSVVLTFLAGAEIDPDVLRANFRESLSIGFFSFLVPGLGHLPLRFGSSAGRCTRPRSPVWRFRPRRLPSFMP